MAQLSGATVRAISVATTLLLCGCDVPAPKPKDMATQAVPPPPSGTAQLFADEQTVSLQVRPGDCAKTECHLFRDGRWRPMPRASMRTLPLLAVSEATGSDYSDGLWRPVAPGRAILINAGAARQTLAAGHLDGLRVGLSNGTQRTYITVYAIGDKGMTGGLALGDGRTAAPATAEVVVHGGKAWLLQQRPDRSANLVDLFAVMARPGPIHCLPGLAMDTSQWAGPVEKALSPNLFVSRAVDNGTDAGRRQAIAAACPAKPAKSGLKERLGL
jgi:hypothetical protein